MTPVSENRNRFAPRRTVPLMHATLLLKAPDGRDAARQLLSARVSEPPGRQTH